MQPIKRKSVTAAKEKILRTALLLFMEQGYKTVSYEMLVKKTGLSKGAIYHHFKSKEDLLVSVFQYMTENFSQNPVLQPEDYVKDQKSFMKLYVDSRRSQIKGFKEFLDTKELKFNKFLFFFEAINENDKLKKMSIEILKYEMNFLERCFLSLERHNKLPKGKDPVLLSKALYFMLEGTGMVKLFSENNEREEDWIKMYQKTLEDFFKII